MTLPEAQRQALIEALALHEKGAALLDEAPQIALAVLMAAEEVRVGVVRVG